jgi:hypothetical protein
LRSFLPARVVDRLVALFRPSSRVVADLRRRLGVAAHLRPAGVAGGLAALPPRRRGVLVAAAVLLILLLVVWFMVWLWDTPDRRSPVLVQPARTVRLPPPPSDPLPVPVLPPVKSAVATTRMALPTTRKPVPTHKPSPRPSHTPTFLPGPPPPPADVQAAYRTGASWDTGFIGGLDVQNTTGRPQMFTVVLRFEGFGRVHISNAWNAELDQHRGLVILTGGPLAPGASLNVGFEATKEVQGPVGLTSCTINEVACRVS